MPESIEKLFTEEAGAVWRHFSDISSIPRPSKDEERIREHLLGVAKSHGWLTRTDAVGNIVLCVPGEGRLRNAPTLILQSHMDMVGEKNSDVEHDFSTDPLKLMLVDGWIKADGTTLGADNGIGVALSLAVAEAPLPDRLPLELLVTVDEETGLTGAMGLDPDIVTGRHLLNLDSEEDDLFIIGCAGGIDMDAAFPVDTTRGPTAPIMSIHLRGFRGGHSGVQIDQGRENAIRSAALLVNRLRSTRPGFALHYMEGGNKKNAIPRECRMIVSGVPKVALRDAAEQFLQELRVTESKAVIDVAECDEVHNQVLSTGVIDMLLRVPNGVIARDQAIDNLVRTSNNLAVVRQEDGVVRLTLHGRSSSNEEMQTLARQVEDLTRGFGGTFTAGGAYPGWEPDTGSALLRKAKAVYTTMFEKEPGVVSIHAGLEAGIIGDKLQTRELLSIGPNLVDPHCPDERVEVESVDRVFRFVKEIVSQSMLPSPSPGLR